MKSEPHLFLTESQCLVNYHAHGNTLGAPYVCFTLRKLKPWEPLTLFRLMIKRFYHNAGTWCVWVFNKQAADEEPILYNQVFLYVAVLFCL